METTLFLSSYPTILATIDMPAGQTVPPSYSASRGLHRPRNELIRMHEWKDICRTKQLLSKFGLNLEGESAGLLKLGTLSTHLTSTLSFDQRKTSGLIVNPPNSSTIMKRRSERPPQVYHHILFKLTYCKTSIHTCCMCFPAGPLGTLPSLKFETKRFVLGIVSGATVWDVDLRLLSFSLCLYHLCLH